VRWWTKQKAEEAMREREHLVQTDRFIAECKNRIARQRDVIASAFQKGHATEVPVSMLRAFEDSFWVFLRLNATRAECLRRAATCRAVKERDELAPC
jgi:hypothetical protein